MNILEYFLFLWGVGLNVCVCVIACGRVAVMRYRSNTAYTPKKTYKLRIFSMTQKLICSISKEFDVFMTRWWLKQFVLNRLNFQRIDSRFYGGLKKPRKQSLVYWSSYGSKRPSNLEKKEWIITLFWKKKKNKTIRFLLWYYLVKHLHYIIQFLLKISLIWWDKFIYNFKYIFNIETCNFI